MNYAQITIKDKTVGLKYGMYATQLFFEAMDSGKRLMVGDTVNELGISYLLWYGYLNNCEVKQIDPSLKFEDFYDLVEAAAEGGNEEISAALDVWAKSQPVQRAVEATKKK
jgi:hypothetical protein